MLLLSNLFPFVNMNVAGVSSEVTLLQIPSVLFSEDYASLGTFFILFVQLVPAFLPADDPATGKPGSDARAA